MIRPSSSVGIINRAEVHGVSTSHTKTDNNNMKNFGKVATVVIALMALTASLSSGEHNDGMKFGNRKLILMMLSSPENSCVPLGQPCGLLDWCCNPNWCDGYAWGSCQPCIPLGQRCATGSCCPGTACRHGPPDWSITCKE